MKKVTIIILLLIFFTLFPTSVSAQSANCGGLVGVETAIGCIPVQNPQEFVAWVLRWAIGIVGGIAFLLIVKAGFEILTSSGSPDKIKAGQEQLTAAISGLLLILFSVFLLKLIGLNIFQIPGF